MRRCGWLVARRTTTSWLRSVEAAWRDRRARIPPNRTARLAGAVKLGVARALIELDPELRAQLKAEGYLTRDAREKERRKYGLKKARKAPQYSKR